MREKLFMFGLAALFVEKLLLLGLAAFFVGHLHTQNAARQTASSTVSSTRCASSSGDLHELSNTPQQSRAVTTR